MDHVGLARLALLLRVHPGGILVGAADQRVVGLRIVGMELVEQLLELIGVVDGDLR